MGQEMAGNAHPARWYCPLLRGSIGRAVPAPQWYMHADSHAVSAGRQRAATCGLHAVNHCLHRSGRVLSWQEFNGRALAHERRAGGDWTDGALARNLEHQGARMSPMLGDQHQVHVEWLAEQSRLALWTPETMGCVLHIPGHWVALTRPEAPQTQEAAALLCDSLYRQPFALSAEELGHLFALIAVWQQGASIYRAGEWSVHVVTEAP